MNELGKTAALNALSGKPAARVPFLLLTWGFDYMWQCADVPPWQLARGGFDTWVNAYTATYERHKPDIIIYDYFGSCAEDPILLEDTPEYWVIRDGDGEEWDFIKSSFTLRHRPTPAQAAQPAPHWNTRADIDSNISGTAPDTTRLAGLSAVLSAIGERALVVPSCITGYISACYALGFDQCMQMMVDDPELFLYLADRLSENTEDTMTEYARVGAEAVIITDSWASCDIISPPMFREFALPYQKKAVDAAKAAGLKAILWNLGDLVPILTDEASLNIDAFAFEQPRKDFAVTVLKVRKVFGPNRCLFGNLDSEHLLMRNNPEEIAQAVANQIRESGEGAPFVLSFGSPIPSDTPMSAVDAVVKAVREFQY